jgi:hypothetical protein
VNYTPHELAKLYSFLTPSNAGRGQCIAIIELGGGFRQSDLNRNEQLGRATGETSKDTICVARVSFVKIPF